MSLKRKRDGDKDEENEEWQNTSELGCKGFKTGHAQKENADDGIGKDFKIAKEQAILYCMKGEYQKAIDCSREALVIAQKVGDKVGEGATFEDIGAAYSKIREFHKAIDCHRRSLDIFEGLGDKGGIGIAHGSMGNAYYSIGENQKAIDCHRKYLEIAEELGDKRGIGAAHGNMGIAYDNIGDYQKAIDCHRKHLEIAEELGDKSEIGGARGNMGIAYDNIGDYQKAIDCHRKHLEIAEELGDKSEIGGARGNMGNAYDNIGEYQKAIDCHRKHLEIAEEFGDKGEIGRAHGNMGNAYDNIGEYQKAIDCYRKVLEIAEELGDKSEIGLAHGNIGNAYDHIGKYQKAIDCHRKHLEIAEELGDKRGIGAAHGNMGIAYDNIGDYQKAIDCHRKHLEISEELGDKSEIGLAHGNIGNAYDHIGKYQKAIDCHRKHLEIAEEFGDKGEIGRAHGNMGNAYDNIGEYQKAIDCYRKVLEIAEELGDKSEIGLAHGNIGNAYDNIGKYQKAIDCHRKHLEIAEELGDKGGIGRAHGNMGIAYQNIGEYQRAIDCHRKGLEIAEELGDKRVIGRAHGHMGNAYDSIGEYQKAVDCYRKDLKIAEELRDIRGVAITQKNLGFSYQRSNNDRVACSFLAKSILSYQKVRRFEVYQDGLNTSISNLFAEVHKIFLKSLLNLKQVKSALLVSESGKAKALYDLTTCVDVVTDPALENFTIAMQAIAKDPCLETNEAFFDIALSQVIHLMGDENIVSYTFDHQHNLHAWVISRKGVFHNTWKTANGLSTKAYGESINRGIQECLMRNLPKNVSHSPEPAEGYSFGGNAKKNHLDLPFIGNKDDRGNKFTRDLEERVENLTRIDKTSSETMNCDPNISVLKSLKGRYNLDGSTTNQYGFHNSSQNSREENEKDTKKVVEWYSLERANVTHGRVKNGTVHRAPQLARDAFQTSLEKLYSIYISPIEEYLVGSKILVIPEGSLFKVPFCALLNSKKEHLCDRYSLQFTPALHVLNASLLKPLPGIGPALFVGNPIVGYVKFNDEVTPISQLANAKVEAEECSKYFNAEPLLEEKATKENVLKRMKDASVIHIAAHGDMDHADIFLAPNEGAPKLPSEEHYLLMAKDVVECTLKARLVVLSCCHSGRGQISAEGVVGIARSFLGAGARSVLVSLWRILDAETMEFMKLFYEKVIQGVSVCVALQQTMIEMKKKYGMAAWSFFQIVGEDISLSKDEIEEIRRQSSAREDNNSTILSEATSSVYLEEESNDVREKTNVEEIEVRITSLSLRHNCKTTRQKNKETQTSTQDDCEKESEIKNFKATVSSLEKHLDDSKRAFSELKSVSEATQANMREELYKLRKKVDDLEKKLESAEEEQQQTLLELGRHSVENGRLINEMKFIETFKSKPVSVTSTSTQVPQQPLLNQASTLPQGEAASNTQCSRVTVQNPLAGTSAGISVQVSENSSGIEGISLANVPTTFVERTVYNHYNLLLLAISDALLSRDVQDVKTWASRMFSINVTISMSIHDVFLELDRKKVISASNLNLLRGFFEEKQRFDLVHLIDCFETGDYNHLSTSKINGVSRVRRQNASHSAESRGPFSGTLIIRDVSSTRRTNSSQSSASNQSQVLEVDESFTVKPKHQMSTSVTTRSPMDTYGNENGKATDGSASNGNGSRKNTAVQDRMIGSKNVSVGYMQRSNRETGCSQAVKKDKQSSENSKAQSAETPGNHSASSQDCDSDDDDSQWLCSHYKRRCHVKFDCCNKYWPCHRCHNNAGECGENKLKSRDTKYIKCVKCGKEQKFTAQSQFCNKCHTKLARYFCAICKHLTGTDDHPYHCSKCGICRIHNDRSFHCDVCGVCLDVQLRGNHKCRAGSAHDECCICLEDAFTGCQILPCSHKVHKECATRMIRSGITRCPICRESFAHKLEKRPLPSSKKSNGKH